MAEIEFHRITADNIALFDTIAKGVYEAPVRENFLRACLASPDQILMVAVADGAVVGKAQAYIFHFPEKPSEIYIEEIDVAKKYRRRGIATGLMDAVGAEGRKRGIAEYWLVTEKDNDGARALYERKAHRRQKSVWYEFYC